MNSFYFLVCRNYFFFLISSKIYCHMHLFCADFNQKLKEVISVHHYDLMLLNRGGLVSTADRPKKSRLKYVFLHLNYFFLHRHKWMLDVHSG